MLQRIYKRIKYLLYISPIVLGMIGYYVIGHNSFWESMYASVALYFVNPIIDSDNVYVLIAEFIAVFVTANFLFIIAKEAVGSLGHIFINRYEDSTAVYGDEKFVDAYTSHSVHSYVGKIRRHGKLEKAKNQVIMFDDDMENINFLNDNEESLKDKNVFVQLNEIDSFLLGKNESNIHYFNMYEIVARKYWRDNPIDFDKLRQNKKYKIAFVGYDFAGKAVCRYGLMNNLYFVDQQIEYHIWDINKSGADLIKDFNVMNDDKIVIHDKDIEHELDILSEMDRIILASEKNLIVVQALLYRGCQSDIYYFSDGTVDLSRLFNASNIYAFGDLDEVISEEFIRKESMLEMAKLFNYDYAIKSGNTLGSSDADWQLLNGFTKGSNIARADHYAIEKRLRDEGFKEEEIGQMEHIRWCRYHYINNWQYAPVRDNAKRKHNLLVPYDQLPDSTKGKLEISNEPIETLINNLL